MKFYPDEDVSFATPSIISVCCGTCPLGETYKFKRIISGVCSKCKDNTTFEEEIDDE